MDPKKITCARGEQPHGDDWGLEAESQWGTLSLADGSAPRKIPTDVATIAGFYAGMRDAILDERNCR